MNGRWRRAQVPETCPREHMGRAPTCQENQILSPTPKYCLLLRKWTVLPSSPHSTRLRRAAPRFVGPAQCQQGAHWKGTAGPPRVPALVHSRRSAQPPCPTRAQHTIPRTKDSSHLTRRGAGLCSHTCRMTEFNPKCPPSRGGLSREQETGPRLSLSVLWPPGGRVVS